LLSSNAVRARRSRAAPSRPVSGNWRIVTAPAVAAVAGCPKERSSERPDYIDVQLHQPNPAVK